MQQQRLDGSLCVISPALAASQDMMYPSDKNRKSSMADDQSLITIIKEEK